MREGSRPRASAQLSAGLSSAGTARRVVEAFIMEWGIEADIDVACLVVSELVTNAVRYGGAPICLDLDGSKGLRIEVHDAVCQAPQVMQAAAEDLGGRGLAIVSSLANQWGFEITGGGKCVWAEL
ncbi:MAG: ATP-binding protein [Acidimicrobiales bacterium]